MNKLTQAIEYAKTGDKSKAKQLLSEVIQIEPNNELAWLWMAGVVDSIDQQVYCLKQVIRINPSNQDASKGLSKLEVANKQVKQNVEVEKPAENNRALNSNYQAQPLPDISQWSNGFTGWSILDRFIETGKPTSKLGILIAEAHIATKRIFGWAAFFIVLAVLFGYLSTRDFPNLLILAGIAAIFLIAALYRAATWYLNYDLKVEIFREGFTLRNAGKTQVVLWREIDHVKEQWQKVVYQGIIHIKKHKIEIYKTDGQKLELNRSFEKIEEIGRLIQLAVADYLLPATIDQLNNNGTCDFGAFTITRLGITHKDKEFLPWNEVKSLEVYTTGQTTLKIQKIDSSKWGAAWATENGGAAKNLHLFLSLAYWFINAARQPITNQMGSLTSSQETDGDVYYRLPVTKKESRDGIQKIMYIGTSLNERRLVVKIPPGVQSGTTYRFPDYGRPNPKSGAAGTLNIEIAVEKVTPLQTRLEEFQILGGGLLLLFGMMWLGFWSSLDLINSTILAAVIGGVGGGIMSIRQRFLGAFSGAVGGAVCFILQIVYYQFIYIVFGRESFWNYEMMFVLFLSALPGIGLYLLLAKVVTKKQS